MGSISAIFILLLLLVCLGPTCLLWSVNTLAALGGAEFYIPHSFWSYWVALIFILVVRVRFSK
jgi:hypothetical protein